MPTSCQTRGPDTEAGRAADKTRPEGGAHSEGTAPPNGRNRAVVGAQKYPPLNVLFKLAAGLWVCGLFVKLSGKQNPNPNPNPKGKPSSLVGTRDY